MAFSENLNFNPLCFSIKWTCFEHVKLIKVDKSQMVCSNWFYLQKIEWKELMSSDFEHSFEFVKKIFFPLSQLYQEALISKGSIFGMLRQCLFAPLVLIYLVNLAIQGRLWCPILQRRYSFSFLMSLKNQGSIFAS